MFIWAAVSRYSFYAPTGGPFIYAPGNTRPVPYLLPSQQFSLSISNANNSFPPTRMMQLCNNYQDLFWIHCWEMLYWRDLLIIWGERRVYIYTYMPHCERTQKYTHRMQREELESHLCDYEGTFSVVRITMRHLLPRFGYFQLFTT